MRPKTVESCTIQGCKNRYYAKGYCWGHYDSILRKDYIINYRRRRHPLATTVKGHIQKLLDRGIFLQRRMEKLKQFAFDKETKSRIRRIDNELRGIKDKITVLRVYAI